MNKETWLKLIIFLSFLGIIASGYLTYLHYKPISIENPEFCDFSQSFNCSTVNKSSYSLLFGIPVAILGILAMLAVIILSFMLLKKKIELVERILLYLLSFNLVFALYLLYTEIFLLNALCLFCLILDGIILLNLVFYIKYKNG